MFSNTWTNRSLLLLLSVLAAPAPAIADDIPEATHSPPEHTTHDHHTEIIKGQVELLERCSSDLQSLMEEKNKLRSELDAIKARMEAVALQDMEEETTDSNESHSRSRGIRRSRGKRGTAVCEGGTVSQWACGSQCIFKLKGLCGLSLRAMCHC